MGFFLERLCLKMDRNAFRKQELKAMAHFRLTSLLDVAGRGAACHTDKNTFSLALG